MVNYFMTAMESKGSMGTSTNTQQQLLPKMELSYIVKRLTTQTNG